ncbi:N-acetyltransferase family protein [Oscillibacter sp.]|uniref:GNAT family N-acetyltransferase n=1 Tax=Oscillibacter sp. TaxID=1945593 RepID=UPI00289784A8|nr:N-acetyltransferase family protein [Oscillibacter sp.]
MENDRKNCKIRVATPEDAEALVRIYAPYVEKTAITFEYDVPSVREFAGRIEEILKRYPYLVAEEDGEILGYAYAHAFHERAAFGWAVETTVYIAERAKRRGLGKRLYDVMEQALAAQNILNLYASIAYPAGEDPHLTRDSVEFHQRLGYKLVGHFSQCGYKFGRWYDSVWMEKHLGPHTADQPAVKPFDAQSFSYL